MKKLITLITLLACIGYSATQNVVRFNFTYSDGEHEITAIVIRDEVDAEFAYFAQTTNGFDLVTCTDLTDESTRIIHGRIPANYEPIKIEMER